MIDKTTTSTNETNEYWLEAAAEAKKAHDLRVAQEKAAKQRQQEEERSQRKQQQADDLVASLKAILGEFAANEILEGRTLSEGFVRHGDYVFAYNNECRVYKDTTAVNGGYKKHFVFKPVFDVKHVCPDDLKAYGGYVTQSTSVETVAQLGEAIARMDENIAKFRIRYAYEQEEAKREGEWREAERQQERQAKLACQDSTEDDAQPAEDNAPKPYRVVAFSSWPGDMPSFENELNAAAKNGYRVKFAVSGTGEGSTGAVVMELGYLDGGY